MMQSKIDIIIKYHMAFF